MDGFFNQETLSQGINLANFQNTPQYQQANLVKKCLNDLWKKESELRTIQYVEIKFLKDYSQRENLDSVKVYLNDLFNRKLSSTAFYKMQFDKYYILKPNEEKIKLEFAAFQKQAYQLAQPKEHLFSLTKQ